MKETGWKPKKASTSKGNEDKKGSFLVELSIISPDAKKALEDFIGAHGSFP